MNSSKITSLLFLICSISTRADTVVVPANLPDDGSGYFSQPSGTTLRYQEVFPASFFGAQAGAIEITQFAWREGTGSTINSDIVIPSLQIDLSTTAATPKSLSTSLDSNVGSDQAVVYPPSAYLLKASRNPTGNGPFDIKFQFAHPFTYNPAQGNLLIDLVITFVAADRSTLSFGKLNDSSQLAFMQTGLPAPYGSGPTTEFTFSPTPEPGIRSLMLVGLIALVFFKTK